MAQGMAHIVYDGYFSRIYKFIFVLDICKNLEFTHCFWTTLRSNMSVTQLIIKQFWLNKVSVLMYALSLFIEYQLFS